MYVDGLVAHRYCFCKGRGS